ncbi:polyhydroxyalkanoate synthesis repressor PhaR [Methylobacterium oryzihabitans]|uniref:Polyhydroxyalkanoate synthesis repressor PhaR n=1 Tax=Methylobacterium oryzihabitans TaxID=2499852 RepID=A0A437NZY3_9HYPH|nr:polyhydroxyalkanoate synthesis repressor PhaR [Methylobacterium oryzihabitans]RVU15589.1 polyhydroxyalkanoate synthesis repressor PhaR [Methylobacterium oryzihabitans]
MADSGKSAPTVIKKYANRRLYHTGTSTYVTLEDLAAMVQGGEDFVVYDAKSGEDITRSVLAQIIFEQENKAGTENLLPVAFLRQLIRFYGDSMRAMVPSYLEFSMDHLAKEQNGLREKMAQTFGPSAFQHAMEEQVRANVTLFSEAMRMFTPFTPPGADKPAETPPAAAPSPAPRGELDDLKRQMIEMQNRLEALAKK